MTLRERNALLAPLTTCGLRRITRDRGSPSAARSVEEEAREMLTRFLATLPCSSASDLMRRCFPFEHPIVGVNRRDLLDK